MCSNKWNETLLNFSGNHEPVAPKPGLNEAVAADEVELESNVMDEPANKEDEDVIKEPSLFNSPDEDANLPVDRDEFAFRGGEQVGPRDGVPNGAGDNDLVDQEGENEHDLEDERGE